MASGIYTEIKKRIELAEPGTVFLTSDFTDIATTTTVRKCLGRQVEEKNIRRIMDGVYEKPVYSKLLKEYIPANPDAIAYAIARSFRWTIAPCGDVALNKLGLSTQVPANVVFVTDGSQRRVSIGKGKGIFFKHTSEMRLFAYKSHMMQLIVTAMREIGEGNVTDEHLNVLREHLANVPKEEFNQDIQLAPIWVRKLLTNI